MIQAIPYIVLLVHKYYVPENGSLRQCRWDASTSPEGSQNETAEESVGGQKVSGDGILLRLAISDDEGCCKYVIITAICWSFVAKRQFLTSISFLNVPSTRFRSPVSISKHFP